MSTHGPDKGKEHSLVKGLEDVGRAYERLQHEQPPEMLDQAILNKARRELKARPRWMQFGWPHAVSTAAVFVLAFFVILKQREPAPAETDFEVFDSMQSMRALPPDEDAARVRAIVELPERRSLQKSAETSVMDAIELETAAQEPPQPEAILMEETGFSGDSTVEVGGKEEQRTQQSDEDVRQQLLDIMRLKMVGDESWKDALDAFLERHPDYPLPHELRR